MCFKPRNESSEPKVLTCPICDGKGCSICRWGTPGVVICTQKRWDEVREIRIISRAR